MHRSGRLGCPRPCPRPVTNQHDTDARCRWHCARGEVHSGARGCSVTQQDRASPRDGAAWCKGPCAVPSWGKRERETWRQFAEDSFTATASMPNDGKDTVTSDVEIQILNSAAR